MHCLGVLPSVPVVWRARWRFVYFFFCETTLESEEVFFACVDNRALPRDKCAARDEAILQLSEIRSRQRHAAFIARFARTTLAKTHRDDA
jgi:hypothetical protein